MSQLDHPYTYVLIRKDISPEQQAVQAAHATLEAGFKFEAPARTSSLIMLEVKDRYELLMAAERLSRRGIEHIVFNEPDFEMGESALATKPLLTKRERNEMRKWPLYQLGNRSCLDCN